MRRVDLAVSRSTCQYGPTATTRRHDERFMMLVKAVCADRARTRGTSHATAIRRTMGGLGNGRVMSPIERTWWTTGPCAAMTSAHLARSRLAW